MLALFTSATFAADTKPPTRVPLPRVDVTRGEKCVEPTEDMQRNHMNYLMHQRDDTVHNGIRTTRHSLKNCIDCHADPQTNSVLGANGFCQTCHTYAAVTMDCFSCHTPKRAPATATRPAESGLERIVRQTAPVVARP